jgi:hypothetical protein
VTNQRRISRIEHHEDHVEARTQFIERDILGNPWRTVDSIAFAGVMYQEEEYETLADRLRALRLQVAMIVDFHGCDLFEKMLARDVPLAALGRFGAPLKDLARAESAQLELEYE